MVFHEQPTDDLNLTLSPQVRDSARSVCYRVLYDAAHHVNMI